MDGDPTPALTGRRRTRPTSIGCRNPWQPKPGRAPLTAAKPAVQTNRATSGYRLLIRVGPSLGITPAKVKLGQYLFMRHGGKVVFFGRFVAVLRVLAAF